MQVHRLYPKVEIRRVIVGGLLTIMWLAFLTVAISIQSRSDDEGVSSSNFIALASKFELAEIFQGADHMGPPEGNPVAAEVYDNADRKIGYAFVNTDFLPTIGYSGKPIHIAIAMDMAGKIVGAKLLKHSEPIVLVGIPDSKIKAFIDGYVGLDVIEIVNGGNDNALPVDIVSGATVTVIIIDDAIKRAAIILARSRSIGNLAPETTSANTLRMDISDTVTWNILKGDGSIQHMLLTVGDVNEAFIQSGNLKAIDRPEKGADSDLFIDMHTALVSQPSIGRSLLGEREYKNLKDRLVPDQQAFMIMANGRYSYRGSGFVRGGIFDRFQIIQGTHSWLLHDKAYKNLAAIPGGGPKFDEVGLFVLPHDGKFDPALPWRIQLLIQRAVGPLEKAFITKSLNYVVAPKYLKKKEVVVPAESSIEDTVHELSQISAISKLIWSSKSIDVAILIIALVLLTVIFYAQKWIAKRPILLSRVRIGFLLFTLLWLGLYNNAQLSVVNVFTFAGSILKDFNWDYFLKDPLLFVLWLSVAATLILWGRGVFCGWLCPFGALQELLNKVAKLFKVPQVNIPWALHELLLSLKYLIFLALFGLSLYSMPYAEHIAEIEPFKTVIILKFAREWPFVIYAITLLSLGLFVERFYCRYVCPLGAALAIPARLRTNDWLKRYKECGNPCQRCANECMVQAIMPDGSIHPNECISCLHCQELYTCDHRCPVVVKTRIKRERQMRRITKSIQEVTRENSRK